MPLMSQDITCLFCFNSFPAQNLHFRCKNPRCKGIAPDPIYANFRGMSPTLAGHVIIPNKGSFLSRFQAPTSAKCEVDGCRYESHDPLCPLCHFELPYDITQVEQHVIAIIGGRGTGKTHYIATLMNELRHDVGRNFRVAVQMVGEDTRQRWNQDFYKPLYVDKKVLQATQAGATASVKIPLIFRLTFIEEGSNKNKRAINLTFFDTAGEDMASLNTMSIETKYITRAEGIIFLLDPLQIDRVRTDQRIDQSILPPADSSANPEYIIERLRELFERQTGISARDKISANVAFALSKVDALAPLLEPDSALRESGGHFGEFNLDDAQSVSTEIRNLLEDWISSSFCNAIEGQFASYNYFGLSALGEPPTLDQRVRSIAPLRVEDPLLWMLYKFGLIKAKKRR